MNRYMQTKVIYWELIFNFFLLFKVIRLMQKRTIGLESGLQMAARTLFLFFLSMGRRRSLRWQRKIDERKRLPLCNPQSKHFCYFAFCLKRDLSKDITVNLPIFSLANTFNLLIKTMQTQLISLCTDSRKKSTLSLC
jgi:hypothetical protein